MKRVLFWFVCVLMLCAAVPGLAADETLVLPADLKEIREEAFYRDASVRTVRLPEGVTKIGAKAFAGSGVTAVNLPDSLKEIADDAFDDTAVTSVTVYAISWPL